MGRGWYIPHDWPLIPQENTLWSRFGVILPLHRSEVFFSLSLYIYIYIYWGRRYRNDVLQSGFEFFLLLRVFKAHGQLLNGFPNGITIFMKSLTCNLQIMFFSKQKLLGMFLFIHTKRKTYKIVNQINLIHWKSQL